MPSSRTISYALGFLLGLMLGHHRVSLFCAAFNLVGCAVPIVILAIFIEAELQLLLRKRKPVLDSNCKPKDYHEELLS